MATAEQNEYDSDSNSLNIAASILVQLV